MLLGVNIAKAQVIKGIVREQGSLEPIIGASVETVSSPTIMIQTDETGRFLIKLKGIDATFIRIRNIGYSSFVLKLEPEQFDSIFTILLQPAQLQEVEIKTTRDRNLAPTQIVTTQAQVKNTPSIGGIPDLVRVLATQPGVSSGGEIFSGLYVRGGNDDQNLFVLDGAPIYGASHLFNIVSLFNADALKRAQLYKGVFPARFGGRLASVLDVNFKEGSKERLQGNLNIGFLNASGLVEMPLGSNKKTSLLLAGRTTYLNLLSARNKKELNDPNTTTGSYNSYNFFDLNARINHEFNTSNKLYLNFYYGNDEQKLIDKSVRGGYTGVKKWTQKKNTLTQQLVNLSVCARLQSVLSDHSSLQLTTSYNAYMNKLNNNDKLYAPLDTFYRPDLFTESSLVEHNQLGSAYIGGNWSNRLEWLYTGLSWAHLRTGMEATIHHLKPGSYSFNTTTRELPGEQPTVYQTTVSNTTTTQLETALYSELEIKALDNRLMINPGLRLSSFSSNKQYALEPRLLTTYMINNNTSMSIGVGRTVQYLHTLNGSGNRFDKSIWIPSNSEFPAQKAWMGTLGIDIKHLPIFNQGFSVEGYYRKSQHQTLFLYNPDDPYPYYAFSDRLLGNGQGNSFGIDMIGRIHAGHFDCSIGYSLSKNEIQFSQINNRKPFPAKYDRRHDLKISTTYQKPQSKWFFAAYWTLNSGHRYTLPIGFVDSNPLFFGYPAYVGINNAKLPPYHRLDLMARWERPLNYLFIKKCNVSFNLLNAYARKNPYGLVLDTENITLPNGNKFAKQNLKGVALFPILPSISAGINF